MAGLVILWRWPPVLGLCGLQVEEGEGVEGEEEEVLVVVVVVSPWWR